MKNEIIKNSNETQLNIIKNEEEICPFCNMSIPLNIFKDHTFCHAIEEEEKANNNILNNNINTQSTNKGEDNESEDKKDKNISDKFFGFLENVKNKAKEIKLNYYYLKNSINNNKLKRQ